MYAKITDNRTSVSASPAPSSARRGHRESDKHRNRNSIERRISNGEQNGHTPRTDIRPRPSGDRKHEERRHHSPHHHRPDTDNAPKINRLTWRLFGPVQPSLLAVQGATKELVRDKHTRARILREELVKIGNHVADLVSSDATTNEEDEALFW